mmetsp:Transcript_10766/g.12633  ORF Transcript_10766/g.12633 Transcript_10766/m.12633 type:complete len:95 (+) Transcript_10766:332-616(+)
MHLDDSEHPCTFADRGGWRLQCTRGILVATIKVAYQRGLMDVVFVSYPSLGTSMVALCYAPLRMLIEPMGVVVLEFCALLDVHVHQTPQACMHG